VPIHYVCVREKSIANPSPVYEVYVSVCVFEQSTALA
jgi:hypothetical protein